MADAALEASLERFRELLPKDERDTDLISFVASSNSEESLRIERGLPVTVLLGPGVHPAYFSGPDRIGEAPWRLCFTDGGGVPESPVRERLLDEAIRLAEAMHDKNPFGEVGFDGGKTVFAQSPDGFAALTVLYGDVTMSQLILGKGGIRYYAIGDVDPAAKQDALQRWARSSSLAGVLAHRYIGGPDMRMTGTEMLWIQEAVSEIGGAQRVRQHAAVTGLTAEDGGFPHDVWELTGRTVAASLLECLRHPGMAHYGLDPARAVRVTVQGFGDVGGSVVRLLTEQSPDIRFAVCGVADEWGAVYRAAGLDARALLALRAARRPVHEYAGDVDWSGSDGFVFSEADVFVPAAIPNVINADNVDDLRVRIIAEGANNAVAPGVEAMVHRRGILYLPGQALNWGGVKGSTLEALFRELTKRAVAFGVIEERVRAALEPLDGVDVGWALEVLRSGLGGPPLALDERRAFAIALLEDLARSNARWLMDELVASRHERMPIELVRTLSRRVRSLKVQMLTLIEAGLGAEFFDPDTPLVRLNALLDNRLKELLSTEGESRLTRTQVVEQRQMLQQLQGDILNGLSPSFASLEAALDLARQKVMDPDGYSQASLRHDLATLVSPDASVAQLEASLHRLQRVHPGPDRPEYASALCALIADVTRPVVVRRNAALAMAKLGSTDSAHRDTLEVALEDEDVSLRASARWALYQMAIATGS